MRKQTEPAWVHGVAALGCCSLGVHGVAACRSHACAAPRVRPVARPPPPKGWGAVRATAAWSAVTAAAAAPQAGRATPRSSPSGTPDSDWGGVDKRCTQRGTALRLAELVAPAAAAAAAPIHPAGCDDVG
eukprot:scaffold100334_cov55-Phaeocystis_antarctica.AAC.1